MKLETEIGIGYDRKEKAWFIYDAVTLNGLDVTVTYAGAIEARARIISRGEKNEIQD